MTFIQNICTFNVDEIDYRNKKENERCIYFSLNDIVVNVCKSQSLDDAVMRKERRDY